MPTPVELLRQGRTDELWQRYLGFLDLSLDEFMQIQKRKVLEQVAWMSDSELGRRIIGSKVPTTVEEFRELIPLTTYSDYAAYLIDRKSDALPEEAMDWMRTSGRSGEYTIKWAPMFREAWEDALRPKSAAIVAMAASRYRGDFRIRAGDRLPYMWAPPPYGLGFLAQAFLEEMPIVVMPDQELAAQMSFQDRIDTAMQMALRDGIDHFFGLSSVLVKIGERFAEKSSDRRGFSKSMAHPKVLWRFARAILRSKLEGRPIYPKDLWDVKGIAAAGTDTSVYAERILRYWGVRPLEVYGSSEFGPIAIQAWDASGLTPIPDVQFYEFIPWDESRRSRQEPDYKPKTVLLDEVKEGQTYEVVLTSIKFTPFMRYRQGDLVRIAALRNEEYGIDLPQLVVEGRCDDVIDLAGFTRLTERAVWYAIEKSGVPYEEWICRKEYEDSNPVLHIWLESRDGHRGNRDIMRDIHEGLKELDSDYRDLDHMLGYNPLRVDLLSTGTFQRYMLDRQAAGAEPAHFKPRHFVHSQDVLDLILEMDAQGR